MYKKILRTLLCTFLCVIMMSVTVFAHPLYQNIYNSVATESKLLPKNVRVSKAHVTSVLRGVFFAAADLSILNNNGKIGVSAKAYMKEPVDEVYMTIYLDQMGEDGQWVQVAYYDFEFLAKDYPDGLLTPGKDFTIMDQPSGHYYRLRAQYIAFLDGAMEAFGPATDGVFIE
ncbi:hypothetical protein [Enterocloster lavalensis]|uniref:hypothetical protein n=1 Tax=Enterocloster lavalensis TaxID=460384 RepID=UPI001D3E0497|nr:hypothetical protein [Enterocloster lavalensis]MBS5604391.1 hypothetical protein [Enterocloster asparagiformis]